MKNCFYFLPLLLVLAIPVTALGQIPNASFENWTGTNPMVPDNWFTNDVASIPPYSAGATPVTRTTTANSGTYALQGAVVSYSILGFGTAWEPWIQSTFSYTGRPKSLTGYYRYTAVSRDSLQVSAELYSNSKSELVAVVSGGLPSTGNQYTKFTLPLEYTSASTPDSAWIYVIVAPGDNDTLHIGSTFLLDDLAFEGVASGINASTTKPAVFALEQNYPNPFNPSTMIRFELPEASQVRLSVYNLLGEELAVLVDEHRQAGVYEVRFDASGLASGTYFYRIEARHDGTSQGGSFVQVRKMTVVK